MRNDYDYVIFFIMGIAGVSILAVTCIYRIGCFMETRLHMGSWLKNRRLWPNAGSQTAVERCRDMDNLNAWQVAHPYGPNSVREYEELNDLLLYAMGSHMLCQYVYDLPILDETIDRLATQTKNWIV